MNESNNQTGQTNQPGENPETKQGQQPEHKLPPKLSAYSGLPQVENWLEEYLGRRAPQLPEHWRKIIAKLSPWITLVALLLGLPFIFASFGLFVAVAPAAAIAGGYRFGGWSMALAVVSIASLILELIALPGLFKLAKNGWVFIFYAGLITTVVSVLGMSITGLIGDVIGLYILFQIKNQYK